MTANTIKKKSVSISFFSYSKYLLLLMKPRVMSLVIFTCAVGLLTAPESVSFLNEVIAIGLGSFLDEKSGYMFQHEIYQVYK